MVPFTLAPHMNKDELAAVVVVAVVAVVIVAATVESGSCRLPLNVLDRRREARSEDIIIVVVENR